MKKKLILVIIAAFSIILSNAHAQENKFGVKAGLNYAGLSGEIGFTSRLGYNIGTYGRFGVTERFSVKPELLYSLQGAGLKEFDGTRLNYSYINIPFLGSIMIAPGFSIEVGPQLGILISAKIKDKNETESLKDNTYPFEMAIVSGLNYELESGLNFGLRNNYGLSNTYKNDPGEYLSLRNMVVQFSIGYTF